MSKIIEKGTPKELIAEAALGIPSNAIARNYIFKEVWDQFFQQRVCIGRPTSFLPMRKLGTRMVPRELTWLERECTPGDYI